MYHVNHVCVSAPRYGVLVFPGQHLSSEEQALFGRRFGVFEAGTLFDDALGGNFTLSNAKLHKDGSLWPIGSRGWLAQIGNEGWHADSTCVCVWRPPAGRPALLPAPVLVSTPQHCSPPSP